VEGVGFCEEELGGCELGALVVGLVLEEEEEEDDDDDDDEEDGLKR
jgi:hypothetical protein